jgi:type IV pilus assembly protein PilA
MRDSLLGRRASGFTLIELLVVIVIIALLMAIAIPAYLSQQAKAKDAKAKVQLNYAYRALKSSLPENNNIFGSPASLASNIQASEPELTASVGGCSAATTDKTIVVDSGATTSTNAYIYGRSDTGTTWRLSATPTDPPAYTSVVSCTGANSAGVATLSGNEITDATRAANTQGDGNPSESSTSFWESSTNPWPSGGMETGTTAGWAPYTGGPGGGCGCGLSTLSAQQGIAKFGSYSLKVAMGGAVSNEGTGSAAGARSAAAPAQTWTASEWVLAPVGAPLEVGVEFFDSTPTYINGTYKNFSGTGSWQLVSVTGVAPAATAYVAPVGIRSTAVFSGNVYLDGVQVEQKPIATPYIETKGVAASRAVSFTSIPVSSLNATQGWVAFRARMDWNNTSEPRGGSGYEFLFDWRLDANNRISAWYQETTDKFGGDRWSVGSATGIGSAAPLATTGLVKTIIFTWNATTVATSVDGGTFSLAANALIPAGLPATAGLGAQAGGGNNCDCDIFWEAAGTGTISQAEAQTIASFSNSADPLPQDFSATANAKVTWNGNGSSVVVGP